MVFYTKEEIACFYAELLDKNKELIALNAFINELGGRLKREKHIEMDEILKEIEALVEKDHGVYLLGYISLWLLMVWLVELINC